LPGCSNNRELERDTAPFAVQKQNGRGAFKLQRHWLVREPCIGERIQPQQNRLGRQIPSKVQVVAHQIDRRFEPLEQGLKPSSIGLTQWSQSFKPGGADVDLEHGERDVRDGNTAAPCTMPRTRATPLRTLTPQVAGEWAGARFLSSDRLGLVNPGLQC
jgi:hypothetical protein